MLFDFSKKKHVLNFPTPARRPAPKPSQPAPPRALGRVDQLIIENKDALAKPNALSHIPVTNGQLAVLVDGDTQNYHNSVSLYEQLVPAKKARSLRQSRT